MRSIRLSLIAYFLCLLILGLGGVSLLAYRTAAKTLADKEANARVLNEAEYLSRKEDLRNELDATLLRKVKQVISRHSRPYRVEWLNVLPVLSTPMIPMGFYNIAGDMRMGRPPLSTRLTPIQLRFQETRSLDQLVPAGDDWGEDDEHPREACETNFANGQLWERTNNLAFQAFTIDDHFRDHSEVMQERFDDVKLGSIQWRRVTMKVPRAFAPPPTPTTPTTGTTPGTSPLKYFFRGPPPPNAFQTWRAWNEPHFFVQYAIDSGPLTKKLNQLAEERADRLARLSQETQTTLDDLRRRLFYLCGMTGVSDLVGGLTLIWMGLAPLGRLSDAVKKVSEKNFQLQLDPQTLPTELQPVAECIRQSLEELHQAFAREKQASQDISHDLRTPLAALLTTIEVALKKERTSAEYRELMEDCKLSANQMSHLVERLLALAKVDSGSNPARPRPVDIVEIAQRAADLVRPLAKARNITMSMHVPKTLPTLADADKLNEALVNLLHNAVDYNRDGGRIALGVQQTDGMVELSVADTGVGIRPEAKEHLFERFYRADPSRSGDSPHCGLGLAIVKSYVKLMGGTIDVDSEPGQGATFRIRVPYHPMPGEGEDDTVGDPHDHAPHREVLA